MELQWALGAGLIALGLWYAGECEQFDLYDKAITAILLFGGWAVMVGSI